MNEKEVIQAKINNLKEKINSLIAAQINARNRGEFSMIPIWQKDETEKKGALAKLETQLESLE